MAVSLLFTSTHWGAYTPLDQPHPPGPTAPADAADRPTVLFHHNEQNPTQLSA